MTAATRFHPNLTGRELRKILHSLFTAELLAHYNLAAGIDPMHLKHLLCHI
jgi:hypothetical protein